MSKLFSIKLDVSKIDKNKLYQGKKGTYLTITGSLNDEPNEYGQNISIWEEQTQEERESGSNKNYLGNGKVFWSSDGTTTQAPQEDNDPLTALFGE